MTGRSFVFDGYGAQVRIGLPRGFDPTLLERHVAPEIQLRDDSAGPLDLLLTCWNGTYRLVYGERRYGPYSSFESSMRGVSNAIHYVLGKRSPMTFLHAGAVEIDGGAVIFPGRSRWGKSTLVASLVERGCGYLSDEYAVISEDGAVFPLSKSIRLRREGGAAYLHPPGVSAPGGLRCSNLILTRFEEGARWDPESLTAGAAILETVSSALQSTESPERVLASLSALVQDADCYQSPRGDLESAVDAILQIVGASPVDGQQASL